MRDDRRDEPRTYGSLPPQEALALLGNEIRASILWELSEARGGKGPPVALSFSELRSRVAPDTDSSQFNYHLQKLVGLFVERLDDGSAQPVEGVLDEDEGYALRPEGTTLTRVIRAWTVAGEPTAGPFEVARDCYFCSSPLEATYRNAVFAVQCPDCEYLYEYDFAPPGVVGEDDADTLTRAGQYLRNRREAFARGPCPQCGHRLDTEFVDPAGTGYPRTDRRSVLVNRSCRSCGGRNYLRVGELLLREPELICFCHERGLDVTRTPTWDLAFAATDRTVTTGSESAGAATLAVELDGDRLDITVDDRGEVVDADRE